MKRTAFRLLSLLLVIVLFVSLSVPAAAAGINNQIKSGPSSSSGQQRTAPTMPGLFNKASNSAKVKQPKSEDYFSSAFAMYANAPMGHSIKSFDHWVTDDNSHFGYIYHGSRVYVLAEHGSSYCVLYYTEKNVLQVGWVPSERLVYDYPGRVYQLGSLASASGVVNQGDLIGSWSKDNFVRTKTKFTLLNEPVKNCVGFTLDYQLITKSTDKDKVLGPRSVYVNDGSGWTWVGDFDYSAQGPCHVSVVLDSPMDLVAVATVPNVREPNGFTFRQSLLDVLSR